MFFWCFTCDEQVCLRPLCVDLPLQKKRRRADSTGAHNNSSLLSDTSSSTTTSTTTTGGETTADQTDDALLTPKRPLVGSAVELNTPPKPQDVALRHCTPQKSPIKGLAFSPSQFLNSPGFLDSKTLTSTPVFRRLQRESVTPGCKTRMNTEAG